MARYGYTYTHARKTKTTNPPPHTPTGHKDQPGNRMLGVVAPSPAERGHNATLTEVYACGKCGKVFRFPRAVALARWVLVGLGGWGFGGFGVVFFGGGLLYPPPTGVASINPPN